MRKASQYRMLVLPVLWPSNRFSTISHNKVYKLSPPFALRWGDATEIVFAIQTHAFKKGYSSDF
ncbi:hypothetical protein NGY2020056_18370 [Vibrio cholerae]